MPNLLIGWIGVAIKDLFGGHDHTRSTKTALQTVLIPERFLDLVEFAVGGHAFDGQNLGAVALNRENGAALDGFAVQLHGASAT
jgi:hypothetical protein